MVSRKNRIKTCTQLRNWKTIILLCVMFSILLTTYTLFDNVDVSANGHRRPDYDDTDVAEEEPEKPVEQESMAPNLISAIGTGAMVGIISSLAAWYTNQKIIENQRSMREKRRIRMNRLQRQLENLMNMRKKQFNTMQDILRELHNRSMRAIRNLKA